MKNSVLLDKSLIENLSSYQTPDNLNMSLYEIEELIDNCTMQIATNNNLINLNNVELQLAGDYANNTVTENSNLDIYLIVKSGQIELNSVKVLQTKKVKFWNKIKEAWNKYKLDKKNKRRFFKRKNKEKYYTPEEALKHKKLYTVQSLKEDYFNRISEQLSNLSVIYNYPEKITILSKEELGYKINLIPAFIHDDGELRVWNNKQNKFISVYFENGLKLLNEKNENINNYSQNNNVFLNCIKVYKGLAYNIFQTTNYSFVESLLYNCPNEIFEGDLFNAFVRSLNYLKNAHIEDFYSIYNEQETMFKENNISIYDVKGFLKSISEMMQIA